MVDGASPEPARIPAKNPVLDWETFAAQMAEREVAAEADNDSWDLVVRATCLESLCVTDAWVRSTSGQTYGVPLRYRGTCTRCGRVLHVKGPGGCRCDERDSGLG